MRLPLAALLLAVPLAGGPASAQPRIELGEGTPSGRFQVGAAEVRIAMESRLVDGVRESVPVLAITEGDDRLDIVGRPSGFGIPQGTAEAVDMDASAPGPEVVFTSYTGGAHCCTAVEVARRDPEDGWKAVSLGQWDGGGPDLVADADGDGFGELMSVDNAFLYAFDCYACSEAPLKIVALRDGRPVDVTGEPRFLPLHREWLADMEARLAEAGGDRSPGFWAGWIATKIRLGEGAEAWAAFRQDYDPAADEGVEVCAVEAEVCPDAEIRTLPFPDALRDFLHKAGYPDA
ncbi:hypothetical protein [Chthonobacter rhizosphaerae]|uniref:hypothetical protein n=1 Tax=Chthonobacter rhizosphaerae TaxID=2735553 RepID=UPI0015EF5B48|nr:hypothetical protein [Chthonobacter rhizosphaerae]